MFIHNLIQKRIHSFIEHPVLTKSFVDTFLLSLKFVRERLAAVSSFGNGNSSFECTTSTTQQIQQCTSCIVSISDHHMME